MTTGELHSQVESNKLETLQSMRRGNFDLHSEVTASAVAVAAGDHAVVLVALNGYRSNNPSPSAQSLAVTVEDVARRWLLSDVQSVGLE